MSQKNSIIIDTGYIVALFNEKDEHHRAATELDQQLGDSYQFVSTVFVLQEICWLLSQRVGHHMLLQFMDCVHAELILFPALPNQWVEKATVVLRKYSDKKLDLADASIVVLADHLNLGDVLSVDVKDFTMLRWGNGKKTFHNLMSF